MPDTSDKPIVDTRPDATKERFWRNINKDGPIPEHVPHLGQCWIWTAGKTNKGYGALYQGPKMPQIYTHKFSWIIHNGPVPDGLWVLHKCDNRACCRPDHLFVDTPRANTLDGINKGRMFQNTTGQPEVLVKLWKTSWKDRRGEGHETHKLTTEQVLSIRSKYQQGVYGYKRLAAEFGISAGVIKRIILRLTWRHI